MAAAHGLVRAPARSHARAPSSATLRLELFFLNTIPQGSSLCWSRFSSRPWASSLASRSRPRGEDPFGEPSPSSPHHFMVMIPSPLEPIWAHPSPSRAEASSRDEPTPKSLRSSLAVGTTPLPASPGCAGPWPPYEHRRQGGEGPDPPSQTRGMESHRCRRRPGFARRPLPAAATGEGARRGRRPPVGERAPVALGGTEGFSRGRRAFSSRPLLLRFFYLTDVHT
jgi:hypothetical protein